MRRSWLRSERRQRGDRRRRRDKAASWRGGWPKRSRRPGGGLFHSETARLSRKEDLSANTALNYLGLCDPFNFNVPNVSGMIDRMRFINSSLRTRSLPNSCFTLRLRAKRTSSAAREGELGLWTYLFALNREDDNFSFRKRSLLSRGKYKSAETWEQRA